VAPKLVRVQVEKLLEQFDHEIKFPAEHDFAIIYGPNGVGKTKLLELTEAVIKQETQRIIAIPFKSLTLTFSGNVRLTASPTTSALTGEDIKFPVVQFSLHYPRKKTVAWTGGLSAKRGTMLRRITETLPASRINELLETIRVLGSTGADPEELLDPRSSIFLETERYFLRSYLRDFEHNTPSEAQQFLNEINISLIETQRLLNTFRKRSGLSGRESADDKKPTVVKFAEDLSRRLRAAMAENSRVSQKLDRNFPRRVLDESQNKRPMTEVKIRLQYNEQNELRTELAGIAVLDAAPEVELPARELDVWERRFLSQYLYDTGKKLASFKWLLDRTRLFRDIVNSRFLFKQIIIDREHGFRFTTNLNHEIAPTQLSSGEQHEVVLAYNLLFNVEVGSLVLIDEPEISLHVSWQQDFINDIKKISDIVDLRFLVATHSPQIIHHWWDHATALAPFEIEGES
jgi:predicted ATP-binding protein involved in virulence